MHPVGIPLPRGPMPDWLVPLRQTFFALLISLGLKASTISSYALAVDRLCAEVGRQGLMTPNDVDEATLVDIRQQVLTRLAECRRQGWASVLNRFIAHLVREGAIAAAPPPAPTALDTLCADYGVWLRTHCGSAPGTIKLYRRALRSFLMFRFGGAAPGDLNAITRADMDAWFSAPGRRSLVSARSKAPCLRSLLRFLFATGWIHRNLALSVPRIAGPRSSAPPRHLTAQEVERVLAAARGDTAMARRDHAMLLTMARFGLRGEEIIAVRLDDIDWQAGEILIRGKGAQQATMPLPVDVGEAMVNWIQHGRRGSSRYLFVCVRPPFQPFTSLAPVRAALRRAHAASGVAPPGGEVRCHVFRHSMAMNLLQGGTPLADIGNLLRHRSAQTTTVYARHDIQALRSLARPWPVETGP